MAIRTFLHFVCQFQSKCTKFHLRGQIITINMSPIVFSHQNKKMTSLKWRLICKYHIYIAFCPFSKHGNISSMNWQPYHDWIQALLNRNIQKIIRWCEVSSREGRKCRHDLRIKRQWIEWKIHSVFDNKRCKYNLLCLYIYIDVPWPLTNDLWVFLFQTIDAEYVKWASPAITYVYVKAFIVNVN